MRAGLPTIHHAVCIATQREITNLVPILALGAQRVLTVTTPHAERQGWPRRLANALGTSVEEFLLTDGETRSPASIARSLLDELDPTRPDAWRAPGAPVAFLWSGGQKPHAAGLWRAFEELFHAEPGCGHIAIYPDPNRGFVVWRNPLQPGEVIPHHNLATLQQMLATTGCEPFTAHGAASVRLWSDGREDAWPPAEHEDVGELLDDFMTQQALRARCFRSAQTGAGEAADGVDVQEARRALELLEKANKAISLDVLEHISRKVPDFGDSPDENYLHKRFTPWLRKRLYERLVQNIRTLAGLNTAADARPTVPGSYDRFSMLFEGLLAERVLRWLRENPALVKEAWLNYHFQRTGDPEQESELDLVLWTRSGKLIVLDAKTYKQDHKTRRAQERSVGLLGGAFATRFAVVPAFSDDVAQPWYPQATRTLLEREAERGATGRVLRFDETDSLERALEHACR